MEGGARGRQVLGCRDLEWGVPAVESSSFREHSGGSVFKAEGLVIRAGKEQRNRRGPRRELGALSPCREQS